MSGFFKKISAPRLIAFGFAFMILLGSILLSMPFSIKEGQTVSYIDALYTSTSAVCVTGLIAVDAGDNFTIAGQVILALLIQIGGLGVTVVGAGVILAVGKKVDMHGRHIIKEGMNLDSGKGTVRFIKNVLFTTFVIELAGAILSFTVFIQKYPFWKALGISVFHSIAAFNNSGFDILGGGTNLIPYQDDIMLNIVTSLLIIFGGIGFLVIREVLDKGFKFKKFSMHAKVVLTMTSILLVVGTLLIKLTEGNNITWLGAFFSSVTTRTAGFSTFSFGNFTTAGLIVVIVLMFIGASPGSTGGGIKTTTFFSLLSGIKSSATNTSEKAFKYSLPEDAFRKSSVITLLGIGVISLGTFLMQMMEPHLPLEDILFEITSAFGTVGLSTGITSNLGVDSKILSIIIMYFGRLGPLTVATLWYFDKGERIKYPEGNISIG